MNKKSIVLILLLTLPIMLPLFTTTAKAYTVTPTPSTNPTVIEWYPATGYSDYQTLLWNPEFLQVEVLSTIYTTTTIIVDGLDAYQQNIEAKAVIPTTAAHSSMWILNDTHTIPPEPVAFAQITRIIQQNGTDNTKFLILTCPYPFEQYLGQYQNATGYYFQPGMYTPDAGTTQYLVTQGENVPYGVQNVPVEPNSDPIKIAVNWVDKAVAGGRVKDLLPQSDEFPTPAGAKANSTIWFEGLDEHGNKVIQSVFIPKGTTITGPITGCTYSTLCKVWGGDQADQYYIFTESMGARSLFYYYIQIDYITIHPGSFDILAYPGIINGKYPGVTNVTVALRDSDGNLVNAEDYGTTNGVHNDIIINLYTSGGVIQPARTIIAPYHSTVTVNLTADTNPRTINVTADANIPVSSWHLELNLAAWTEMTFDGINSAPFTGGWPIHTMLCGYTDASGARYTMNAPFEQYLPPNLGGPQLSDMLNGPIYEVTISLQVGCNLISSPVYPLFNGAIGQGIPMDLLFGKTSAVDTIVAIWWYDASISTWKTYIPGIPDPTAYFCDGVGYWIKAEKACSLELSGVAAENAPFTPAEYTVHHSWNLMGFTSVNAMTTGQYLESLATNNGVSNSVSIATAVGPVWSYDANARAWTRDPAMLWPGQGFWMNYKFSGTASLSP